MPAPPVDVWPWIAQLGQNRGGFYSYDGLENLVGCQIHSSDQIVPAWQDVTVGDAVNLAPEVALNVATVDPPRAFVLSGGVPMGESAPPYDFSWSTRAIAGLCRELTDTQTLYPGTDHPLAYTVKNPDDSA